MVEDPPGGEPELGCQQIGSAPEVGTALPTSY